MKMKFLNFGLVKSILPLLPSDAFRKLRLLSAFQITTTILDIVAIFLLGLLSKAGLEFVQGKRETILFPYISFRFFTTLNFEEQFTALSVVVIVLFLLRTLLAIWGNRKVLNFLGSQSAFASKQIINRLFNSKPQYVISKKTQELLYGVTAGIDSLVLAYLGSLVLVVSELFFLSALIGALLLFEPVIGICSLLIFGGAGFWIHRITAATIKADSIESGKIAVNYNQQLLETLQLYREYFLRGSILDATTEVQKLRYQFLKIRANIMFLPILSKYLFEFVLILGGALVATIQFTITDANDAISSVVVFLGASSRILPSVIRLQGALLTLKQAEGASQITLQQIEEFKLNRIYSEEHNSEEEKTLPDAQYILIDDLHFRYPEQQRDTLRKINVSISKGQLVALVGESGAGKSTLADLLLGIQEPSSGSIRIEGMPPRMYRELHPGAMAYVPQDIAVLDGSVLKNVTLTSENESDLEMAIESLERAFLWKDLEKKSLGLHLNVGEGGGSLSGGQKQRLGIARALYTRPSLVVFDEATSSLDPKTEKAVTDAIYASQGEVTLIVIAHRLSTVKKADLVLLLDNGELVANGTFEEVRSKSPNFDEQVRLVNL